MLKNSIYLSQFLTTEQQKYNNGSVLWISGPKATIYRYWKKENAQDLKFELFDSKIKICRTYLSFAQDFYKLLKNRALKKKKEYSGLIKGQFKKAILCAMIGYKNYLMVRGVGYKFIKKNQYLSLHIGYSHNINIILSSDIKMKINRKTTLIKFQNENYAFLHGILAIIRNFKKPDVYKGKGLRYKKEKVILKEGKKKKVV